MPMDNKTYAIKVADMMGVKTPTKEEFDGDCHVCLPYYPLPRKPAIQYGSTWENPRGDTLFDPATDPASAHVWETWLMDNDWKIIEKKYGKHKYYFSMKQHVVEGHHYKHEGKDSTPLLALKAASEKFFEANK